MSKSQNLSILRIVCYTLLVAFTFSMLSCSDKDKIAEPTTDPVVEKLDLLIVQMTELMNNSAYGFAKDKYPQESKEILVAAISSAQRDILLIKYSVPKISSDEKDRFLKKASAAIASFEASKRSQNAETPPSYLFVDGNNGGYIDFDYSSDYSTFGATGNQAFTIEFWVKITTYGKEDNSILLSTFVDMDNDPKYRSGWMMYSRNRNILRLTTGVKNTNDNDMYRLWEPSFAYTGVTEWVHFAIVYNDKGLDGNPDLRAKLYKNGVVSERLNVSELNYKYNSEKAAQLKIPMTAFSRFTKEKKLIEGFAGYMRKIRIWKTDKNDAYIKASKEGTEIISSSDPNLVCGWDLQNAALDDSNIADITGRHFAKIVGAYKWENR